MTIWFTSDTHFNHANILHLGRGRPFATIEEHDEALIENWNHFVGSDDTVYHLGDVALGPWPIGLNKVSRLKGYKILIPGNHDRISYHENSEVRRQRFMPDYEAVFDAVWNDHQMNELWLPDLPILRLSHYPYEANAFEMSGNANSDNFRDVRPIDDGVVLIHGHTHQQEKLTHTQNGTAQVHVGVDSWGYRPVSLEELLSVLS